MILSDLALPSFFVQMKVETCSNPKIAPVLSVLKSVTSPAILPPSPEKSAQ